MCKGPDDNVTVHTVKEVGQHKKLSDLWVVIEGKVYDLSKWALKHPGGLKPLIHTAGKDATVLFNGFHPSRVKKMLAPLCIGTVAKTEMPVTKRIEELRQKLVDEGFFSTDRSFYQWYAVRLIALFSLCLSLTLWSKSVYWKLLGAIFLGLFWHQGMLLGHDLCHNSVNGRKLDYFIAQMLVSLFGISSSWWKASHNNHHIVTNAVEHDADIQHLPFFVVDSEYFKSIWSTWHKRIMDFDDFSNLMVRNQAVLFYPIMMVARVYLYIQSVVYLATGRISERRGFEIASFSLFYVWFPALICQLPTWGTMAAYFFISHAVAGILHVQICISHFPMPTYMNMEMENDSEAFFKTQLVTSLDVTCPWYMDWFHGGLQFQVEHHLFPHIPRHNLRKVQPIIKEFCEEMGWKHHSVSFFEANRMVVNHLYEVSKKTPNMRFTDTKLYDLLCARG
uniref:Cytochrome b5 heme-binding domain-containing protein n=1 Tax=Lotharella oceanica TaxID=641309 RepID=A0A7S2TJF5_9EUKA|mmetsp:Transcript_15180/g.28888  ORF Transcript_15180/g.28888 Transcript_15180/m.28888 type:complete len:449 (+) Transcript_15180:60-1406(+)